MSFLFYYISLGKLLVLSLVLSYHFSLTLMSFVCCKACIFTDFCRKAILWPWIHLPTSVCIRLAPFQLSPLEPVSSTRTCKLVGSQRICSPLVWHGGFKEPRGFEELILKKTPTKQKKLRKPNKNPCTNQKKKNIYHNNNKKNPKTKTQWHWERTFGLKLPFSDKI